MLIEKQVLEVYNEIKARLKDGPVKTIPPPPGYKPPSYYKKFKPKQLPPDIY